MKFKHAIVGGTFDRFHKGHRKLLATAFAQSEKVTIGITTEGMFKNKEFAEAIQDYDDREQSVSHFLSEEGFADRATRIPINDIYGNSLVDKNIDAIFVTVDTKPNAHKINDARKLKNWDPLEIVTVPFVLGEDNEIISSERIRKGTIDREGNSYMQLFTLHEQFHLPESEKEAFRQPIGHVTTDIHSVIDTLSENTMLIAVGDIVAQQAQKAGRLADITIIDGRTRRHDLEPEYAVSFANVKKRETQNPAGSITQEAAKSILAAITDYETTHAQQLIAVSGEEDLLAIPSILLAPLSSVVIYGQFDKGIVVVKISEQKKQRLHDLFRKFQ